MPTATPQEANTIITTRTIGQLVYLETGLEGVQQKAGLQAAPPWLQKLNCTNSNSSGSI